MVAVGQMELTFDLLTAIDMWHNCLVCQPNHKHVELACEYYVKPISGTFYIASVIYYMKWILSQN